MEARRAHPLQLERIAMLFAAWLVAVVVLIRALAGDLPVEISGGGFRYADVETAQDGAIRSEQVFKRMESELDVLRKRVVWLEEEQDELNRRYAVKGDGHEY